MDGNIFSKTSDAREKWNESVELEDSSIKDALYALDMAANPDSAKAKLQVTVNADGTVNSPYYVNYPSAKGTIKCRVIYNDSTHGVQLVSVNPVDKVRLGKNDPNENVEGEMGSLERARNSHNRAILTLNEKIEEFIETSTGETLAIDARSVCSSSQNKNYPCNLTGAERQAQMYVARSEDTYMEEYNGTLFLKDVGNPALTEDAQRLWKMGARGIEDTSVSNYYWCACYCAYYNPTYGYSFSIPWCDVDGMMNIYGFVQVNPDGELTTGGANLGIRPIFMLSDDVKIIGGEGTAEVPFEIGL